MADDDDLIPDTGAVFTFGRSRFADNIANKFWIKNDPVLYVDCGDEHSAVLTERGRVYVFGSNEWGQLGLGHLKPLNKPSFIKTLKPEKIILLACGRSHTLVYSESGKLFSFGANGDGQLGHGDNKQDEHIPKEITALSGVTLKSISCGAYHSAALTEKGEVYVWGVNSDGQIGLGEVDECSVPTKLTLENDVISLSCGYYHTALITNNGHLFTFGENENGKLGLADSQCNDTTYPQSVAKLEEDKYAAVSCGARHTVAITEKGHCYSWGDGSHGQLGHGTMQLEVVLPKQLDLLNHLKMVYVSCGDGHTAVISDSGKIYTFGDGRHGKLGQGDECFSNLFKPTVISRFIGFHVNFVACGGCHMLVGAIRKNEENTDAADGEIVAEEEDILNASMHSNKSIAEANMTLKPGSITYPLVTPRDKRRHKKDDILNNSLNMNSSLNSSLNMAQLSRTMVQLPTVLDRSRLPKIPGVNQISINNYERREPEKIIEDDEGKTEVEAEKKDKEEIIDKDCEDEEVKSRKDKDVEITNAKNKSLKSKDAKEENKENVKVNHIQGNKVKLSPLKKSKKILESEDEEDEEEDDSEEEINVRNKQKVKVTPVHGNKVKKSPQKKSKKIVSSENEESEADEDDSEEEEEEIEKGNKRKGKVIPVQGNKVKKSPQKKSKKIVESENEDDYEDDSEEEIEDVEEEDEEEDSPDEEEGSPEIKKKKKVNVHKQKDGKEGSKGKLKNKEVNKKNKVKGNKEVEESPGKKSLQKKTPEKKIPGKKSKTVKEKAKEEEEKEDDDDEDEDEEEDEEDDEEEDEEDDEEEDDDEEDDGDGDKTDGKTKKKVKSNGANKETNIEETKTEANNRSGFLNFFRRNKKPQVDVAPSGSKSPEKKPSPGEETDKNQSKMCTIL